MFKITKTNKKEIFLALFTAIIVFSGVIMVQDINNNTPRSTYQTGDLGDEGNKNGDMSNKISPISSQGSEIWWNGSFQYRQSLNVSNPFGKDVENAMATVTFNYTEYVNAEKMNASLKDIRIVQDGEIQNYFVQQDYPNNTLATVYFEADLILGQDTSDSLYMYYGNDTVEYASAYYNQGNRFGTHWLPLNSEYDDVISDLDSETVTGGAGAVSFANSIDGKGLLFDPGQDSTVEYSGFNTGPTVSISGWTKGGGNEQMPFSFSKDSGRPFDPYHYSNNIYNNDGDGGNTPFLDIETTTNLAFPTDNEWHHYVWENIDYENGTTIARFWLDGVLEATATYKDPTATDKVFQISGWAPNENGYIWDGMVDDIRIFDYGLSKEDVQVVMNSSYINTTLGEEQVFSAYIDINILDVDGRIVPNAEVQLINESAPLAEKVIETQYTNENGTARFQEMDVGVYNITVQYDTNNHTFVAYNSTQENFGTSNSNMFNFTNYINEVEISVDIWTIDFYAKDYGLTNPMDYGFIEIYEDKARETMWDNITLASGSGNATFRGRNLTKYYYDVYYRNVDYFQPNTIVANGTVNNTDLVKNRVFEVIQENQKPSSSSSYTVDKTIYANGTDGSERGVTKLINSTIDMTNMEELSSFELYYVDINGQSQIIDEYSKTYSGTGNSEDTISVNYFQEGINAYGIQIVVQGDNSSTCNGQIDVAMSQTTSNIIETNISKVDIQVVDDGGVVGAIVRLWDGKTYDSQSIVNLTTSSGEVYGEKGFAYGAVNKISFWYYQGVEYNISLRFGSSEGINFQVNYTNPDSLPDGSVIPKDYFNFTLDGEMSVILQLTDSANYIANFTDYSGDQSLTWGEQIDYNVEFQTSNDGGENWNVETNAEYVRFSIYLWGTSPQLLYQDTMTYSGSGIYQVSVDSSEFSAGYTSKNYAVQITGKATGFPNPTPITEILVINARQTETKLRNNNNPTQTIENKTVEQYYNELKNITISFSDQGTLLQNALLDYSWTYGSGNGIGEDPMNPGYYTFQINTSDSPNIGKYSIDISIRKENYTIGEISVFIQILSRPTTISEQSSGEISQQDLLRINLELQKTDSYNLTYTYREQLADQKLVEETTIAQYTWEYTTNGTSGVEQLELLDNGSFLLDFDTEKREVGSYILLVTIGKPNFDQVQSIIFLTITNRTTNPLLKRDFNGETTISKVKGNIINFEIELIDSATGEAINDATVILKLPGIGRQITLERTADGVYTASDSFEDVDAFFRDSQISGTLVIKIENYEYISRDVTILIRMEEVAEGIPTFYLILGIGAVALIVGALVINKVIQNARIPDFVKKLDEHMKVIKNEKDLPKKGKITESYNEIIVGEFKEYWDAIDKDIRPCLDMAKKGDNITPGDEIDEGGK